MSTRLPKILLLAIIVTTSSGCQDFDGQAQVAVGWIKHQLAQNQSATAPVTVTPAAATLNVPVLPTFEPMMALNTDTPRDAARSFLDAIRTGDEGVAKSLLTSAAQLAVAQQNDRINFPGSPAAVHYVGNAEYPEVDVAHIWCSWCDTQTNADSAVRMVVIGRHELAGWRIAGMVFVDENGQYGDIVNFEEQANTTAEVAVNP